MAMHTVPIMTPGSMAGSTASAPAATRATPASPTTAQVTEGIQTISLSSASPEARVKRNVILSLPLDASPSSPTLTNPTTAPRRLVRRDSLERREALLKGKEGSRQRRRWENDRLLSNPHAVPPLPQDWSISPTHPRRTVPYYLAPLWDAAEFQRAVESKLASRRKSHGTLTSSHKKPSAAGSYTPGMSPMEEAATSIPKEVRAKLKRARGAKGMLKDLEEDVRGFVRRWNEREARLRDAGLGDVLMSDTEGEADEEIVFVGRKGLMTHEAASASSTSRGKQVDGDGEGTIGREKLVCEGIEGDQGAGFKRWLVHCVGAYYGLRTWSVSRETEIENGCKQMVREAYVGVDERARGWMGRGREIGIGREVELPRPLWGMV